MGELGRCRFVYWCTNSKLDAACERKNPPSFPPEIAVDAPFEMTCTENPFGNESGGPGEQQYRVVPASKHFGRQDGPELTITQEGPSSFLAVTPSGRVVDVIQLFGVELEQIDLELTRSKEPGFRAVVEDEVRLVSREEADIRAVTSLAGAVRFDWEVEGEAVELTQGTDGGIRLSALKPGIAQLTVSFGKALRAVEVVVAEDEVEAPEDKEEAEQ